MGIHLDSTKVQIFPISSSRDSFTYAHVLTEGNILNLIRSASSCKSFVISDTYNSESLFEFVINGYYISLKGSKEKPLNFNLTGNDIYAHIFIDTSSKTHPHVWGQDVNNQFSGVTFSTSPDENPPSILGSSVEKYSLHILTKKNDAYVIPLASNRCIDGGLVT